MKREISSWYSPALQQEMPIVAYGHYGFSLLLVPTAGADFLEYERFQLMETLEPFINSGQLRVFSINSVNKESWLNNDMLGEHKAIRQNQFNQYVFDEVVPFIKNATSIETPVITCGASFGALHSMNLFLKRPDLIDGVIAMSGVYNLSEYTKGFHDEQVYYNSPAHYVPNLTEDWFLHHIRKSQHIHILSGTGAYEDPQASKDFSGLLHHKGIGHELDVWGEEWTHDWPTWRAMLPHYLATRF